MESGFDFLFIFPKVLKTNKKGGVNKNTACLPQAVVLELQGRIQELFNFVTL